jgi:hypothetical protein
MSFDLYGLFDQAAQESGQVIDPNDPLAPIRQPGGFNLAQAGKRTMQDRQNLDRQNAIKERAQAQQNARRTTPFATQMNPHQDFIRNFGPGAQANALQGMISQTMGAHQDENDSRVAQMREMRRMEHEKELKRMELDAILARLDQARQSSGPQPKAAFRGGAIY